MERRPWVRDFAPVAAAFALCPLVAALAPDDPAGAIERARGLIGAERALGAFVEPAVHAWAAGLPWLMTAAGAAYIVLHVPALIGALAWAYLCHPAAFPRLRTAFLLAHGLTVAGWLLLPTAPPRLLPDAGFADTLSATWGQSTAAQAGWLQSQYAALPSGHVAFALIAGGAVALLARRPAVRAAGALYPVLMVALILVTANHYWLDAAAAVAVVAVAVATATALHRAPRAARARRRLRPLGAGPRARASGRAG